VKRTVWPWLKFVAPYATGVVARIGDPTGPAGCDCERCRRVVGLRLQAADVNTAPEYWYLPVGISVLTYPLVPVFE